MNLLKMNLFRSSFFKQVKFLFSSPLKSQSLLLISEAGTISKEVLPIQLGFVSADEAKKAWLAIHNLKCEIWKNGKRDEDTPILPISERSYIPLDPNNNIKPKDKERLTALDDIANLRHAEALSDYGKNKGGYYGVTQTIITGSFILLAIMLIMRLVTGC